MTHLDKRISALADGELGHEARDRALAHVAHCPGCRAALAAERALKERLSTSGSPAPPTRLVQTLLSIGAAPEPPDAAGERAPLEALVPHLPQRSRAGWFRRPPTRTDRRRPGRARAVRRTRYAAAGALSISAVVLGAAFAAGGGGSAGIAVVPPAAELSVEHAATTSELPLRDAAFDAVSASFGGLSLVPANATVPNR